MQSYINLVHNLPKKRKSGIGISATKKLSNSDVLSEIIDFNSIQKALLGEAGPTVYDYVTEHIDLENYYQSVIFSTDKKTYVKDIDIDNVRAIINFKKVNRIQHINDHLASVNKQLCNAGIYIGCLETYWERKKRIIAKVGPKIGQVLWLVDFIVNRVLPRTRPFGKIYNWVTRGRIHVISRAEILGRLVFSGFSIIEYKVIDNVLYFVVMKVKEPSKDRNPSYHPMIKLRRVGKNGKMIGVYKFRTMHPYSEYLQDFVLNLNGYNSVGKPAKDFRVARWGRFIRKLWLDEFPQLLNVLRGEMKLVGIRPLSKVRYNQFPEDLKKERIKYKPGCFPPYVALNMPDDKGNIQAERIYLDDVAKHPTTTDVKYLWKSLSNIIRNKIRSS